MKRREFLQGATAAACLSRTGLPETRPSLLILGGTRFLGRAFAEEGLAQGYQVSLFHRGKTGAHLFPEAEHILGDRNLPLEALMGRRFDYVVDTSGQLPTQVAASRMALPGSHYTFISSISVYAHSDRLGQTEQASVVDPAEADLTQELPTNYAARKVACERVAGPDALILRPCLIVGPHDPTDRFTYWVARGAGWGGDWGNEILAPGTPQDPIQWIDARDLARWALKAGREKRYGIYNTLGPPRPLGQVFETIAPRREFVWVPADFLERHQVAPWKDLPGWVPAQGVSRGFTQFAAPKAREAGLTFRSLEQTATDILEWRRTQPLPLLAGLSPERERQLLEAFHS